MDTVPPFDEETLQRLANAESFRQFLSDRIPRAAVIEKARTTLRGHVRDGNRGTFRPPARRTPDLQAARAAGLACVLPDVRRDVAVELLIEAYYDAFDAGAGTSASS